MLPSGTVEIRSKFVESFRSYSDFKFLYLPSNRFLHRISVNFPNFSINQPIDLAWSNSVTTFLSSRTIDRSQSVRRMVTPQLTVGVANFNLPRPLFGLGRLESRCRAVTGSNFAESLLDDYWTDSVRVYSNEVDCTLGHLDELRPNSLKSRGLSTVDLCPAPCHFSE
jgi:hypothetical protein